MVFSPYYVLPLTAIPLEAFLSSFKDAPVLWAFPGFIDYTHFSKLNTL